VYGYDFDINGFLLAVSERTSSSSDPESIYVYNITHNQTDPIFTTNEKYPSLHDGSRCGVVLRVSQDGDIHVFCDIKSTEYLEYTDIDNFADNRQIYVYTIHVDVNLPVSISESVIRREIRNVGNLVLESAEVSPHGDLCVHRGTRKHHFYYITRGEGEWFLHSQYYVGTNFDLVRVYTSKFGFIEQTSTGEFRLYIHPVLETIDIDVSYRQPEMISVLRPSNLENRVFGCDMAHNGEKLYVASCTRDSIEVFEGAIRVSSLPEFASGLEVAGDAMQMCNDGYGTSDVLTARRDIRNVLYVDGQFEFSVSSVACKGIASTPDGKFLKVGGGYLSLQDSTGAVLARVDLADVTHDMYHLAYREDGIIFVLRPQGDSLRLFTINEDTLVEVQATFTFPPDTSFRGNSIATYAGTVVVAASGTQLEDLHPDDYNQQNGVVYVIHPDGTVRTILPPLKTLRFGRSVAIEGDFIAVSADAALRPDMGAVFIYQWDGSEWVHKHTILDDTFSELTLFGFRVVLKNSMLYVSCPLERGVQPVEEDVYAHIRVYQLDLGAGPGTLPPSTARPTFAPTLRPTGAPRTVQDASPSEDAPQGALIGGVVGGVGAAGCALAYYLWRKYGGYTPTRKSIY
jgi:hypothetical protein